VPADRSGAEVTSGIEVYPDLRVRTQQQLSGLHELTAEATNRHQIADIPFAAAAS